MSPVNASVRNGPTWLVIAVLSLCGTVVSLMQTLVVALLPDFPRLLGTTTDNASWLVTITLLCSAVATPIIAKAADMYGKRRMMLLSLAAMLVGSVLGAIGDSLALLIVARALQGLAPALIPVGISIMRDELPPDRVGSGVALMSATLGIGGAIGMPLSGVVYDALGWHALFWISGSLAAVLVALVMAIVPESSVRSPGRFDWLGAILLSAALTGLLLGISKGGQWGWLSRPTVLSLLLAVVFFLAWAPYELRTGQPLVDLRTSARRPVLLTNVASMLTGVAMFANMLSSTLELQLPVASGSGFGLSVTQAGLGMLPGGLLMVVLAPVSATITHRYGARATLTLGTAIMGLGYLFRVVLHGSVAEVVLGSAIIAAGTAIAFASMPILIMRFVPITETAAANGLNTLVRAIGMSLSSATVTALLAATTVSFAGTLLPAPAAFTHSFWLGAAAAFAACGVGLLIPTGVGEESAASRTEVKRSGEREFVVGGVVSRPDGQPLKLAVVSVLTTGGEPLDWSRTDNAGRWSVVLPGQGRYLLVCAAEGWPPYARLAHITPDQPGQQIRLAPRHTLSGLVSRDAVAVADALVVLLDPEGQCAGSTRTDQRGHYRIGLPPIGPYVLAVVDPETGTTEAHDVVVTPQRRQFNVVLPID